ncbi:MAG: fatty acid desaturase CarF family protein, partial [Cyanobacteriota bacterium]|nr:fatty acid desaturase CarF family protein [Cyanobacteriota bacterium]
MLSSPSPHSPEHKVLRGRLQKLRQAIRGQSLPNQIRLLYNDIFFGQNFPEISDHQRQIYHRARRSWAALLLASLGAFLHPWSALLLPVVVKGGWDVGRLLQVLPHFLSDEWSTHILIGFYPGTTQTAFPSVMAFFTAWRQQLHRQTQSKIGFLRAYALTAIPHHVFESTRFDLLNRVAHSDAAFAAAMARLPVEALANALMRRLSLPIAWRPWLALVAAPALGVLHPGAALTIATAAAITAGVYEQFPTHRAAHRPFAEISLLELALQALGLITTRAEHQRHHRPEHAVNFSGSTRWVDRLFDRSGLPNLLNLLAYVATQHAVTRIVPMSWSRDPSRLEALVGEALPLEQARRIATAKQQLVLLHTTLRRALRDQDPDAVLNAPCVEGREATALEVYRALRDQVDGVRLSTADVVAALTGPPLEHRFVRELTPQTPADAWPPLTPRQVLRALTRL